MILVRDFFTSRKGLKTCRTIFLDGWFGQNNFGDDLYEKAFIEAAKDDSKLKKIYLVKTSKGMVSICPRRSVECRSGEPDVIEYEVGSKYVKLAVQLFLCMRCDLYVRAGGDVVHFKSATRSLFQLATKVLTSRLFGRVPMLASVGLSAHLSAMHERGARCLFSICSGGVWIRERKTVGRFTDKRSRSNLWYEEDLGLQWLKRECSTAAKPETSGRKVLGVNPVNLYGSRKPDDNRNKRLVAIMLRWILELVHEQHITEIVFISLGGDDEVLCRVLQAQISNLCSIQTSYFEHEGDVFATGKYLMHMSCLVMARYHGVCVGIASHVPTVALSYHLKVDGLVDDHATTSLSVRDIRNI